IRCNAEATVRSYDLLDVKRPDAVDVDLIGLGVNRLPAQEVLLCGELRTNSIQNGLAVVTALSTEVNLVAVGLSLFYQGFLPRHIVGTRLLVLTNTGVSGFLAELIEFVSNLRVRVKRDYLCGVSDTREHVRDVESLCAEFLS